MNINATRVIKRIEKANKLNPNIFRLLKQLNQNFTISKKVKEQK
jgi:hypothetical protein